MRSQLLNQSSKMNFAHLLKIYLRRTRIDPRNTLWGKLILFNSVLYLTFCSSRFHNETQNLSLPVSLLSVEQWVFCRFEKSANKSQQMALRGLKTKNKMCWTQQRGPAESLQIWHKTGCVAFPFLSLRVTTASKLKKKHVLPDASIQFCLLE